MVDDVSKEAVTTVSDTKSVIHKCVVAKWTLLHTTVIDVESIAVGCFVTSCNTSEIDCFRIGAFRTGSHTQTLIVVSKIVVHPRALCGTYPISWISIEAKLAA